MRMKNDFHGLSTYPRFETEAQGNSEIWLIKLACFRWMPSVYYLKNSLLPDLKMCMESAC